MQRLPPQEWQAKPLQPMEGHGGAPAHLQPVEDPEQVEKAMAPREAHAGAVCHWEDYTLWKGLTLG